MRAFKSSSKKSYGIDEPLRHTDHKRPMSRRDFIGQGFMTGAGTIMGGSVMSLFANPRSAHADLLRELEALKGGCDIVGVSNRKIPFICFDLAGGANICNSNVLMGGPGGQLDFLSTAGYSKMGLPGDMVPSATNPDTMLPYYDESLGLRFHSDSAFLRGINASISPSTATNTNGAVIAARSENDTGNNPHNPMYGINRYGANGQLVSLVGSRNTESGGNSLAPMNMINPEKRPTKVDRPSDVRGLVDVGDLTSVLSTKEDAVAVMEAMYKISKQKMDTVDTKVTTDEVVKELVNCGYLKSAHIADRFGNPEDIDPEIDPHFSATDPGSIFFNDFNDGEFRKTASVAKLVINGFAGAGTVTMGGFDYHGGGRRTGEVRDFRAGRCIGACLEYAARNATPVMIYVFSDGSVASNGVIDDSMDGRGKGEWTGDNSSTGGAFFLVYNPGGAPNLLDVNGDEERHRQIGHMRPDGSVDTGSSPAANNVNLLAETVVLNYMALHGDLAQFGGAGGVFPSTGLGINEGAWQQVTAFQPICNQFINNPVDIDLQRNG